MTRAEVLRAALAKLDRGKTWAKGQLAYDAYGESIGPTDVRACRWCAIGAVRAAAAPMGWGKWNDSLDLLGQVVGAIISRWNDEDGRTWEQVQDAFERAIKHAEATEGSPWKR